MAVAKLYALPGSHACRTATLALEHKGIDYERVDLPTGLHPLGVRLLGFPGGPTPPDRPGGFVAFAGRLGTVPALKLDGVRVQGSRKIARHLEALRPDPPLLPADPDVRRRVEEAEQWGDEVLQMATRRALLPAAARGELHNGGDDGRLGPLLFRHRTQRRLAGKIIGRAFAADPAREAKIVAAVPPLLDRVDAWIADGTLNGERLNAADLMIAPCLGIVDYHPVLRAELERRPAGRLLDRVLPA